MERSEKIKDILDQIGITTSEALLLLKREEEKERKAEIVKDIEQKASEHYYVRLKEGSWCRLPQITLPLFQTVRTTQSIFGILYTGLDLFQDKN